MDEAWRKIAYFPGIRTRVVQVLRVFRFKTPPFLRAVYGTYSDTPGAARHQHDAYMSRYMAIDDKLEIHHTFKLKASPTCYA